MNTAVRCDVVSPNRLHPKCPILEKGAILYDLAYARLPNQKTVRLSFSLFENVVGWMYYVAVPAEMTSPLFPQGKKFFAEAIQITVHQIFPRSKFGQGGSFSLKVEY
jgi:hypothetical protein